MNLHLRRIFLFQPKKKTILDSHYMNELKLHDFFLLYFLVKSAAHINAFIAIIIFIGCFNGSHISMGMIFIHL